MSSTHTARPYYDHDSFNAGYSVIFKPNIGLVDTETNQPITSTLASSLANKTSNKAFGSGNGIGLAGLTGKRNIGDGGLGKFSKMGGLDKNYIHDLEFLEYFDVGNLSEFIRNLFYNFFKNYCKTLFAQPLEIVRLILQVGVFEFDRNIKGLRPKYQRLLDETKVQGSNTPTDIGSESESGEEIEYFQPVDVTKELIETSKKLSSDRSKREKARTAKNRDKIRPVSMHTIDILAAVVAKDGPFALFRGINASFIYQTLSHTIEAWITGFISPFLGIPDPFFLDLTHLTEPLKSLCLSVLACVLSGLFLLPLDLIKVKLMITQFNKPFKEEKNEGGLEANPADNTGKGSEAVARPAVSRSIRESIRNYPVHFLLNPPPAITILTILHSLSTSAFRKTAPYLMFIRFNIDSFLSPTLYTLVNLMSLILELFVKLPVENLLRKEQLRFLLKPKSESEDKFKVLTIDDPDRNLIVDLNPAWPSYVESLEKDNDDVSPNATILQRFKSLGLFNGWRVGILNVIGFWGYNIIKKSGSELREERF